jgi:hypothetical protein
MIENESLFSDEDFKPKQLGTNEQCARKGCSVQAPGYRVILGTWDLQVYVCASHLTWALGLEFLSQNTGEALGWGYGRFRNGVTYLGTPKVCVTEMPTIRRYQGKYTRDVSGEVSGTYPQRGPQGHPTWHRSSDKT